MGWYGDFSLEYKGKDNEKFVKLAKLIIPNYVERFDEDENILECKRGLSWYTAENDVEKILSYLNDKDEIKMVISGETGPIIPKSIADKYNLSYDLLEDDYSYDEDEQDEEINDEEIEVELAEEILTFKKKANEVVMECDFYDNQRYTYGGLGKEDEFNYYDSENSYDFEEYLNLVGSIIENDEDMQDIACKFLTEINNSVRETASERVREFLQSAKDKDSLMKYLSQKENQEDNAVLEQQENSVSEQKNGKIIIDEKFNNKEEAQNFIRNVPENVLRSFFYSEIERFSFSFINFIDSLSDEKGAVEFANRLDMYIEENFPELVKHDDEKDDGIEL